MVQQQIAAVFENGRFRVLTPLALPLVEGQHAYPQLVERR